MFEDLEKETDFNDPVPVTTGLIKLDSNGRIMDFNIKGLEVDIEFTIQLYVDNLASLKHGDIVKRDSYGLYVERKHKVIS